MRRIFNSNPYLAQAFGIVSVKKQSPPRFFGSFYQLSPFSRYPLNWNPLPPNRELDYNQSSPLFFLSSFSPGAKSKQLLLFIETNEKEGLLLLLHLHLIPILANENSFSPLLPSSQAFNYLPRRRGRGRRRRRDRRPNKREKERDPPPPLPLIKLGMGANEGTRKT